ncbi:unnamed protein product [Oikopleura dioica]|uniref:Uncharacterized protein n=1 Tax=Oikopleura dioica TaxID=34765 RepID=E4YE00_OIKDI|nr:unnamed protein product [Oikopleura dioica]
MDSDNENVNNRVGAADVAENQAPPNPDELMEHDHVVQPSLSFVVGDGQPEPGTVAQEQLPDSSDDEERKKEWKRRGQKLNLQKYRVDDKKALAVLEKMILRMGNDHIWGKTQRGENRKWHDFWPRHDRECHPELCPCRNVELSGNECKCRKCQRIKIDPLAREYPG